MSDFDENGMRARYMRYAPQFDDLGFKVSITLWQSVALSFLMRTTENFANIIQEAQNELPLPKYHASWARISFEQDFLRTEMPTAPIDLCAAGRQWCSGGADMASPPEMESSRARGL